MEKALPEKPRKEYSWRTCLEPPWGFKDIDDEKLYTAYTQQQKQRAIPRLLAMAALMQIFALLVPGERDWSFAYSSTAIALVLNLILATLYECFRILRPILNHVVWLILWAQLLISASRRLGDSYNELLGWAVVFQYTIFATLPIHYILLIVYSTLSICGYLLVQYYNVVTSESELPHNFYMQQLTNGSLLVGITIMGAVAFARSEMQQRSSFRTTKRSLRDKLTIEQQSKEQERLLLSVLPEHVAVQMRKELGLIDTQFKKIYMSRHENVSILYADIVGFTAISSTYSAQDLVAILNELFARFDRLAEKYQQLRIKILGDCYYCISGAPVERPDHAVLCVHMGLSMVKAIKYVQQTTNSPVDMRVGIHTGAVLAGVLGQRQWQFDVYSRDVELANKMESSGMAGRVHVSEATLGFLNDEFEVEPAHGERREEMLRQAGIKTYFIVRVLKPYQGGDEKNAPEGDGAEGDAADALSDLRDDDEDSVLSPQDEGKDSEEQKIVSMLQEELVNRDDNKELKNATRWLTFQDSEVEESYQCASHPHYLVSVVTPLALMPAFVAASTFAMPSPFALQLLYISFIGQAGIANIAFYVHYRLSQYKNKPVNVNYKSLCEFINWSMTLATTLSPFVICGILATSLVEQELDNIPMNASNRCIHHSYFYHIAVAVIFGTLWLSPMNCIGHAIVVYASACFFIFPTVHHPELLDLKPTIDKSPYQEPFNSTLFYNETLFDVMDFLHRVRNLLMLQFAAFAMIILDRFMESSQRARYSRGVRMRLQAEQASDLRRRNQALIHNVLPPHVARHFMGAKHHHRDLYSQSYAEVGVLFASMPNFSEFYSEETVNNQGLECLRFLNEVISDFDLLLEDAKFCKDIIKIKTISSTYMAASGLNPTRQMQPSDGVLVRWAHLACLVEFALELQRVLAAINEQSFNHFVLRMGVNHGPITAGVIGARKPHYDIWGNTVNVASRMESTGKAGCIQVTEETCEILQTFGYYFEQRGLVAVKGKGQLMTYYLQGKRDTAAGATQPKDNHTMDEIPEANPGDALLANGDAAPTPSIVNNGNSTRPDGEPLLPK